MGQFLQQQALELRREYPKLAVLPVAADFTKPFELPDPVRIMPRVGFFPGSTIGNFEPHEAAAFLRHAGRFLGTSTSAKAAGLRYCRFPKLQHVVFTALLNTFHLSLGSGVRPGDGASAADGRRPA